MFTNEQRSRMALKLAAMRNGETLQLNKNHITPLTVMFQRRRQNYILIEPKTKLVIASGFNETMLVGAIIDALSKWDDIIRHYHLLIGAAEQ